MTPGSSCQRRLAEEARFLEDAVNGCVSTGHTTRDLGGALGTRESRDARVLHIRSTLHVEELVVSEPCLQCRVVSELDAVFVLVLKGFCVSGE